MALNLPLAREGDAGFTGFASRPDPATLNPGICQMARNKRFVRGRAETRRGLKRLASEISIEQTPITLSFALASDVAVSSMTRSGSTVTVTAPGHGYRNQQTINIRGADQDSYNGDWIIALVDADTFTFLVLDTPVSPATGTIFANGGPVIRSIYTGGLFAACIYRSPLWDDGKETIAMAGPSSIWLWREGALAQERSYPADQSMMPEYKIQMLQAYDRLYILREAPLEGLFAPRACSITSAAGTATVTLTAHGFTTGHRIRIEGAEQAAYNAEFDITVTGPDAFTFPVDHAPVSPATGTLTARRVLPPLFWDGVSPLLEVAEGGNHPAGPTYSRMYSNSIAAYFGNQIVLAPGPARDTVAISDVLDPDTYDPLLKSFRANAGSSDYIVALHPFAQGDLLVFMRRSLWKAHIVVASDGINLDLSQSYLELVTNEVGCIARDSIVTAGQFIFFLSDEGVYRLDAGFTDMKLRGMTQPLSDPISDLMNRINSATASSSNAILHDNRYWLTCPLDDSEWPNAILIYNLLNEAWESLDNYPTGLHTLVTGLYENRRRLFGITRTGNIFVLDANEIGDDANDPLVTETVPIAGEMITRRYGFGSSLPKRWLRLAASIVLEGNASVQTVARHLDPDGEQLLGVLTNPSTEAEDYSQRLSIRRPSTALEIKITDQGRRSTIRSVMCEYVNTDPNLSNLTTR